MRHHWCQPTGQQRGRQHRQCYRAHRPPHSRTLPHLDPPIARLVRPPPPPPSARGDTIAFPTTINNHINAKTPSNNPRPITIRLYRHPLIYRGDKIIQTHTTPTHIIHHATLLQPQPYPTYNQPTPYCVTPVHAGASQLAFRFGIDMRLCAPLQAHMAA